jgi:AraC family transcriptional regulator
MSSERRAELRFKSAHVVHVTMPPHVPDAYTTTSKPLAIGVSFTAHARAVIDNGLGRRSELSFPAGTCGIGGLSPTMWLRVNEPSEAIEINASSDELASVAEELGTDWGNRPDLLQPSWDPLIWGVCARFRMAALGAMAIDACEADSLVHSLLVHVAIYHLRARWPVRVRGRLDQRRLVRVAEFIEGSLARPPSLREMAEVAAMSPFHFQRSFRAATGLSPHAYVTARRMERARRLLDKSDASITDVAARLGFSDLSHFRRSFRRQFNIAPGALAKGLLP